MNYSLDDWGKDFIEAMLKRREANKSVTHDPFEEATPRNDRYEKWWESVAADSLKDLTRIAEVYYGHIPIVWDAPAKTAPSFKKLTLDELVQDIIDIA